MTTRTYTYQAVVIIRVEADSRVEANEVAQGIAEEINAELPTGATFNHSGEGCVNVIYMH